MKTRQTGFAIAFKTALFVLPFTLSSNTWAGDLDDVSIQVLGLDEVPDEALEHIPLPTPGSPSMVDMREDILLNKPINMGGGPELAAPSAGGDLTTVVDGPNTTPDAP